MKFPIIIRHLGVLIGVFGLLLMIGGVIGFLAGGDFLGVRNHFNWFYFANSFIFLGIFMILTYMSCPFKKEQE